MENEYRICGAEHRMDLADLVSSYMRDGWTPLGGPYYETLTQQVCQAMIRRAPEEGTLKLKELITRRPGRTSRTDD